MAPPSEFHQLLDATSDAMIVVDSKGKVTAVNLEAEHFFGWTEAEMIGQPISRHIPARASLPSGTDFGPAGEVRVACSARHRDGRELPVELACRPIGQPQGVLSLLILRDLSQWRRTSDSDSATHDEVNDTLQAIGDAVITTDAGGRITYLNPVAERLTGWSRLEAKGHALDAVLSLISEASRQPIENTASRCLEEGRTVDLEGGVILLRRDGTEVPVGDSAAPIRNHEGVTVGVVLVLQDESEKRRVGQRLSYEATHDALTGLINRREFERRLTRVVADLSVAPSEQVLLCIDLDRFKAVNDTCGHDAGDELLRSLGPLLSSHLRKRDTLARLGGDEFAVLLENCPLVEGERIAEDLRAAVEAHRFEWAGKAFSIGASIGLLPISAESGGTARVLRAADAACYFAKEDGGNRVHCERVGGDMTGMSLPMARRVTRLARAIDEGHFRLFVQPILSLQPERSPRLRFEVLLRLPDAHGRMQVAADFLPQAERYNLMPAIDRWVIRETVSLLGQWQLEHPGAELPVCSINLSASALSDEGLLPVLEQRLARHGIPPEILCFEIAETAALANIAKTVRFLSALRTIGCGVALEDFGSGVTSFTYLKTLPVNFLKIGGHFVRGVAEDPMYGSIISAVSQIGRSMGIATVAKQVGTEQVLRKLRTLGVGYAQGRALAAPIPLTDSDGRVTMRDLQRTA